MHAMQTKITIQLIIKAIVYQDLQRNFFPTLRRKVVTSKPQPRIEPVSIQTRHIQSRRSSASITRTESKQSNTKQTNQETQKKMTSPNPKQLIISAI